MEVAGIVLLSITTLAVSLYIHKLFTLKPRQSAEDIERRQKYEALVRKLENYLATVNERSSSEASTVVGSRENLVKI